MGCGASKKNKIAEDKSAGVLHGPSKSEAASNDRHHLSENVESSTQQQSKLHDLPKFNNKMTKPQDSPIQNHSITTSSTEKGTATNEDIRNNRKQPDIINFTSGLVYSDAPQAGDATVSTTSQLFGLIKRGDMNAFDALVKKEFPGKEAEVHTLRGMWNSSPLLVAVQYQQPAIANYLLDHPPDDEDLLNQPNEKGYTVILYAVMEGMLEVVRKLIALHVLLDIPPTQEPIYNPMHDTSMFATPLSLALINNYKDIVGILLDNGCLANATFPFPLCKSIMKKKPSEKQSGVKSMTPVLLACAYGHENIIRELVWRGSDTNARDEESSNLLHHLARAKSESLADIFKFLVSNSKVTDEMLSQCDGNGDTPLHVACDMKQLELAKLMLFEGCNASVINNISGFTPLHLAIRRRHLDLVKILLQFGADPSCGGDAINKQSAYDLSVKLPKENEISLVMEQAYLAWQAMKTPRASSKVAENNDVLIEKVENVHVEDQNIPDTETISMKNEKENEESKPLVSFSQSIKSEPQPEEAVTKIEPVIDEVQVFTSDVSVIEEVSYEKLLSEVLTTGSMDKMDEYLRSRKLDAINDEETDFLETCITSIKAESLRSSEKVPHPTIVETNLKNENTEAKKADLSDHNSGQSFENQMAVTTTSTKVKFTPKPPDSDRSASFRRRLNSKPAEKPVTSIPTSATTAVNVGEPPKRKKSGDSIDKHKEQLSDTSSKKVSSNSRRPSQQLKKSSQEIKVNINEEDVNIITPSMIRIAPRVGDSRDSEKAVRLSGSKLDAMKST